MKSTTAFATLACVAFIASCGGGGSSGTTSNTSSVQGNTTPGVTTKTPTSAASNVTQVIDYHGDSTVYGLRAFSQSNEQVAQPAPAVFAAQLPAAARYVVNNRGVSGSTACQLLNGTSPYSETWSATMRASNAKFVIINHGINDSTQSTLADYRSCLNSLAQQATAAGKIVIFETPNPVDDANNPLAAYVTAMKDVAASRGINVIDQYTYLLGVIGTSDIRNFIPDGTHPSDSTYALKGRYAAQTFLTYAY